MNYSTSGPTEGRSQKLGFRLFLLLNSLLYLSKFLYFSQIWFSGMCKRERKGGVGGRLSPTVCTSNLANTARTANRFHRLFQRRFVDSGFLERCLEEDSEEIQQECFSWLGVSVMEKEVRSGSDSSIPGAFPSIIIKRCSRFVSDPESSISASDLTLMSSTWVHHMQFVSVNSRLTSSVCHGP